MFEFWSQCSIKTVKAKVNHFNPKKYILYNNFYNLFFHFSKSNLTCWRFLILCSSWTCPCTMQSPLWPPPTASRLVRWRPSWGWSTQGGRTLINTCLRQRTGTKETSSTDNKESSATFFLTNSHELLEQRSLSIVTHIPKIVIMPIKLERMEMIFQVGGGDDWSSTAWCQGWWWSLWSPPPTSGATTNVNMDTTLLSGQWYHSLQ